MCISHFPIYTTCLTHFIFVFLVLSGEKCKLWMCKFLRPSTIPTSLDTIIALCGLVVRVPGCRSKGPGFDSRSHQVFWEVVGLERGPLSLVSTIEELLGRNSSGSGLENREYGRGNPLRRPRDTLYPQKLAVTSQTSGGRSLRIVRLRTKTTEYLIIFSNPW
jgi:hypothetical protein